jgi:hypothetical protein
MERFNQAISNKRPLVTGNVSITVVHAEPNFHFLSQPLSRGSRLPRFILQEVLLLQPLLRLRLLPRLQ